VFGIYCQKGIVWVEVIDETTPSQRKFQPVLLSVQIPGKHAPVSLHEDTFIVLSIIVKISTAMYKEIISMVWRDSWDA
jgi:hypothetical protein